MNVESGDDENKRKRWKESSGKRKQQKLSTAFIKRFGKLHELLKYFRCQKLKLAEIHNR